MMSQRNAVPVALRQEVLVTALSVDASPQIFRKRRDIPQTAWEKAPQVPERMGWLTGLEPATTGITIRDSTN